MWTVFVEKLKCMFEPFDGHVWTNRKNLTTDAFWATNRHWNASVAAAVVAIFAQRRTLCTLRVRWFIHFGSGKSARTRSGYPIYPCGCPFAFDAIHSNPSPPTSQTDQRYEVATAVLPLLPLLQLPLPLPLHQNRWLHSVKRCASLKIDT